MQRGGRETEGRRWRQNGIGVKRREKSDRAGTAGNISKKP